MLLTVKKSTASKSPNGGYVNTIEGESKAKVFGVDKTTKHRYMIKTDVEVPVGTQQEINLSDYSVNALTTVHTMDEAFGHPVVTAEGVIKVSQTLWLHEKVK